MNLETFEKLEESKKRRIIEAAMNEFIEQGYLGASTNTIVKNAEISKGALFNYFESKENLFLYLLKINMNKILNNFQKRRGDIDNLDIFEGVIFFVNANIKFFTENTKTFEFITKGINSAPVDIRLKILSSKRELQGNVIKSLIANSKPDYFKKNIKKENIEFMILTMVDTLSTKYIMQYEGNLENLLKDSKERNNDIKEFLTLLKFGILN